ncbi:MAG: transcriptional repressor NrdR [Caldilineaceae bacterium]|nr:transcriptional repressor NrdR [Caldilineaceae bacterium]
MRCPYCGSTDHKVMDTRDAGDSIRRRRRCVECEERFTTYEHVAASMLVVKSDGRREQFDRQKLLSGIQTAATKRPISSDTLELMAAQIEDELQSLGRAEVPSHNIGTLVLDHLAQIDQVAYIRFASVYLELTDLNDVLSEIDRVMGRSSAG